jgi:hypothetical protein
MSQDGTGRSLHRLSTDFRKPHAIPLCTRSRQRDTMGGMDVVLVDRNQRLAQPLRSTLAHGDRLVAASEAQLAGGHWWPSPGHTRAILLVADALDAACMRALHRLWIAEHGPQSYLLTTLDSTGDRLLRAVAGPAPHHLGGAGWRSTRGLTLAHVLTLERLVERD